MSLTGGAGLLLNAIHLGERDVFDSGRSDLILLVPVQAIQTISTIKMSGKRLLQLINDILDAAKMKQGGLVIKHEQVGRRGGSTSGVVEGTQRGRQGMLKAAPSLRGLRRHVHDGGCMKRAPLVSRTHA